MNQKENPKTWLEPVNHASVYLGKIRIALSTELAGLDSIYTCSLHLFEYFYCVPDAMGFEIENIEHIKAFYVVFNLSFIIFYFIVYVGIIVFN